MRYTMVLLLGSLGFGIDFFHGSVSLIQGLKTDLVLSFFRKDKSRFKGRLTIFHISVTNRWLCVCMQMFSDFPLLVSINPDLCDIWIKSL